MSEDLRQMIRSLVQEELAAHGLGAGTASARREEEVRIESDRDLDGFVRRLLAMAKNDRARADIESGRHVFRLKRGAGPGRRTAVPPGTGPASARTVRFDTGLVTEKQVRNLPEDAAEVEVGRQARLTPLAADALRQAGIKIKKVKK